MRALALTLLLLPLAASAQTRVGLGVRINSPSDVGPAVGDQALGTPVTFSVPMDFSENVRIEPLIGLSRRSFESSTSGETTFELTTTATTLGVIVSALVPTDGVTITPGVRIRNTRITTDPRGGINPFKRSNNVLGIGPLAGGEFRFSQRFRIGAEVGLEYQSLSAPRWAWSTSRLLSTTS